MDFAQLNPTVNLLPLRGGGELPGWGEESCWYLPEVTYVWYHSVVRNRILSQPEILGFFSNFFPYSLVVIFFFFKSLMDRCMESDWLSCTMSLHWQREGQFSDGTRYHPPAKGIAAVLMQF